MKSSKQSLATQERQRLIAISEFANMDDRPDAWRAFSKRWPALLPAELYQESAAEIERNVERAKHPVSAEVGEYRTVHEARDWGMEVRKFRPTEDGTWVDYREPEILRLRNLLRDAWRGGPTAQQSIEELLGLRGPSGEISVAPGLTVVMCGPSEISVSADWRRASIVYLPRNEFQAACYALLRHSTLARFCANSDCPAPYFVARRATQRYCSPDCLKPFQKQWKLDWWNREGKARRAKASVKSRKRR
jgi:hypothetical protein